MKKRQIWAVMSIAIAVTFISCTAYKKDHAVSCHNAHVNGDFFTVECRGALDASPEAVEASFTEYAQKLCMENGYNGFRISGDPPQTPATFGGTIECTQ